MTQSLLPALRRSRAGAERLDLLMNNIVDLADDRFTLDSRQRGKRPDWTYRS